VLANLELQVLHIAVEIQEMQAVAAAVASTAAVVVETTLAAAAVQVMSHF
jgi:hypothetical protein